MRAKYPQCFINNEGIFDFVGQWEAIETLVECDSLPTEVLAAHPEIKTFTSVFFRQNKGEMFLTQEKLRIAMIAKKEEEIRVAAAYIRKVQADIKAGRSAQEDLEGDDFIELLAAQTRQQVIDDEIKAASIVQSIEGTPLNCVSLDEAQKTSTDSMEKSNETEIEDDKYSKPISPMLERLRREEGRAKTAAVLLDISQQEEELDRLEAAIDKKKDEKDERERAALALRVIADLAFLQRQINVVAPVVKPVDRVTVTFAEEEEEEEEDDDDDDDDDCVDPRLLSLVPLLGTRAQIIPPLPNGLYPMDTNVFQSISSSTFQLA